MSAGELAAFVAAHTERCSVPFVPELALRQATEATPLWHATADAMGAREPPFWAFAWPGGVALARYVLDAPHVVRGARVLDVACGGGIVTLACAGAGAAHVLAVDADALAVEACRMNVHDACIHAHAVATRVAIVDTHVTSLALLEGIDVVVAGDVFYDRAMSEDMCAFLGTARARGARVLIGDPGRSYVPTRGVRECARYDLPTLPELESVPRKLTRVLELL